MEFTYRHELKEQRNLDRAPPASHNILEDGITCQPLRDASDAAQTLREVVTRAIGNGYRDMTPLHYRERFGRAIGEGMSHVSLWFAPFTFIPAVGAVSQAGLPALAVTLGALLVPVWMGPMWYFDHLHEKERKPSFHVALSNKKVSAAISHMPEGPARILLQDFSRAANRAFALGEIAVVQQEIVRAHDEPKQLRKLYKKGLQLIENAAKDLHWSTTESTDVRAAFNAGVLPPPQEYARSLDEPYRRLQDELEEVTAQLTTPLRRGCA
jgi:hypothetical protein